MKKLAIALSFCAATAFAASWSGTISDSKCGAAHADASEKSVKCAQGCVKSGKAQPVLVSEGKVYKLSDASKATDHVGHKVTVTGELEGLVAWHDWSVTGALDRWERYNGLGYRKFNINSPYLWSYTNQYSKGKFVADGKFDANAVSAQCGAAAMLRELVNRGAVTLV